MNPDRILIWGGGGHGKVVADLARSLGHAVAGFVDQDPAKLGQRVEPGGARVVLSEEELFAHLQSNPGKYPSGCDGIIVAIGNNRIRRDCLARLGDLPVLSLVHPRAIISPSVRVGQGAVVLASAILNADVRLAEGVIVNTGAIVEHDCDLARAVHVSPGAILCGGVQVGECGWIGAGSTVLHAVQVGTAAIVGAGSVVIRDVAEGTTVVGSPAQPTHTYSRCERR